MDFAVRHPIQAIEQVMIAIISSSIAGYSTLTPMKWRYKNSRYRRYPLMPKSTTADICRKTMKTIGKTGYNATEYSGFIHALSIQTNCIDTSAIHAGNLSENLTTQISRLTMKTLFK